MEEVDVITLNDGDYIITDEIDINNVKYYYLTKEDDIAKFCIRKINIINNEEYLVSLDSQEEFDKALLSFIEKNKDIAK